MNISSLSFDPFPGSTLAQAVPYWAVLLGALLGSAVLAFFAIRKLSHVAHARKLFDEVDERTVHQGAIPRLGGLVFLPLSAFVISLCLWHSEGCCDNALMALAGNHEVFLLFSASILLYVVGATDDLITLNYRSKFVAQGLAGVLVLCSGIHISHFAGIFWLQTIPPMLGLGLSFFFLLWVVNAFNLIDGIDGLAGGLALMALLTYGGYALYAHLPLYALICVVFAGILMGYLRLNIWGSIANKNKIFMGDTGSLTIGLLLGFVALRIWSEGATSGTPSLPIAVAVAPLFVPCIDLLQVMLHRALQGRNPFQPDRSHIHHRIMALGYNQRRTLLILLSCSLLIVLSNVLLAAHWPIAWVALLDLLLWAGFNLWIVRKQSHSNVKQPTYE